MFKRQGSFKERRRCGIKAAIIAANLAGNHYVANLQCITERASESYIDNGSRLMLIKPRTQSALGIARPFAGVQQSDICPPRARDDGKLAFERGDNERRPRLALPHARDVAVIFSA
jgi:hypothetical protein